METYDDTIKNLIESQRQMLTFIERAYESIKTLSIENAKLKNAINNMKYELFDPTIDLGKMFIPVIRDCDTAIDLIVNQRKSIARFGDGEFSIMAGIYRQRFQKPNEHLAQRLAEVIESENDRLLIGIANNYGNLERYTESAQAGIREYMTEETRSIHRKFLREDREYYDAYLSRPYVIYKDKENAGNRFKKLAQIWEKRRVIIVEGAKTRFGVGNDFLSGAADVKRIVGPAEDSFDRYDELLAASLKVADADTLFLVALGPCAGVLVYDLVMAGFQAVDIGHADLEYEWFLSGSSERCQVANKYNNEVEGGNVVSDDNLPNEYFEQIMFDYS